MNYWLYILTFVVGFLLTFNVLYIVTVEKWHNKKEKLLEDRVQIWGRCCYTMGYRDGLAKKKACYKTPEQVIAEQEAEEQQNADQTIPKTD